VDWAVCSGPNLVQTEFCIWDIFLIKRRKSRKWLKKYLNRFCFDFEFGFLNFELILNLSENMNLIVLNVKRCGSVWDISEPFSSFGWQGLLSDSDALCFSYTYTGFALRVMVNTLVRAGDSATQ